MIRIFIENKELDVLQDFSHQITYSIDDITNIDTKTTAFSKTIVLPGTANNNQLLGNIFEFSNSNFTNDANPNVGYDFNASKSAKVRVESNGLQIMKGVLRLLEIVIDGKNIEYEVGLFGELGGFVSALGTKRLEDLDFSIYDHDYNEDYWEPSWQQGRNWNLSVTMGSNYFTVYNKAFFNLVENDLITITNSTNGNDGTYIVDHLTNTTAYTRVYIKSTFTTGADTFDIEFSKNITSGYYYPLIDYGKVSGNKHDYYYNALRPALFVKDYIDKIIALSGYTYECDFFETDFFKRLVIPNNFASLTTKKPAQLYTHFDQNFDFGYYSGQRTEDISTQNSDLAGFSTSDNITYTYNGLDTLDFNIYVNMVCDYFGPFSIFDPSSYIFDIYKNGSLAKVIDFKNFPASDYPRYFQVNGNFTGFSLSTGDTIKIVMKFTNVDVFRITETAFNFYSAQQTTLPLEYTDRVYMNLLLPQNIFQKDFFISILKMFNLMVVEDKFISKHLKIIPYTLFYDLNNASYLDWSSKVDRSEPIRIKPMSEVNSRYYELKYKGDSDYYNDKYKKRYSQGYGDVKFDNNLEFVKDTQTSEVIFAATPLVGYDGEDKVVSTIFKWDGTYDGGGDQQNEDNVASTLRILQIKNISGVTSWNVNTTGSTIASYTSYPYAGHFDDPDAPNADINFGALNELYYGLITGALGNNIFNAFYSPYLAEITDKDSRLVTCKMKFTETDIFNLDFSKFIWIDQVLYRLNKIYDYTPNELCKVDLLRVIYTTYDDIGFQEVPASVQIGTQRWTSENLKQTTFLNGDAIRLVTTQGEWDSAIDNYEPAYTFRDFDANNFSEGLFYNYLALSDSRGLGYYGWRIPTLADATILNDYINTAYPSEKAWTLKSTTSWTTANGTDRYGFNAKPLGAYDGTNYGTYTTFALSDNNTESDYIYLDSNKNNFLFTGLYDGKNVRLIKI